MRGNPIFNIVVLLVLAFLQVVVGVSVAAAEDSADAVIARIGDRKIMLSDFNRVASYYDADKQKALAINPQHRERILKLLLEGEVISEIARKKGFDKRKDISEQMELFMKNFLATNYIKVEIMDTVKVTEDDIKTYYGTHKDDFKIPEMVKARHILVRVNMKKASEEDKKKAREKIEGLLKRVKAGEDLGKLAGEFSDDPASKKKGGDLGFFPRGKMVPEFDAAAFALKPGDLSEIIETSFGYHIIRVEERKEAAFEPFEKIKDKVKEKAVAELKKGRIEGFIDKAFKEAGVEYYPDAFVPKK